MSRLGYTLTITAALLLTGNVFVFSIPNVPAIRYLLGGVAAILLFLALVRDWKAMIWPAEVRRLLLWFGALTAWIVFQALVVSSETVWAFKEFKGQWLVSSVYLLLGLGVAAALHAAERDGRRFDARGLLTLIALALAGQVIFTDYEQLRLHNGNWHFGVSSLTSGHTGGSDGRTSMTYVTNLLLALLLADVLARLLRCSRILQLPLAVVVLLILLDVLCLYFMRTRNGIIDALIMGMFCVALYSWRVFDRRHLIRGMAVAALAVAALGWAGYSSYKADSRWGGFVETIPLAWNTEGEKAWMKESGPYPVLPSGTELDLSAYLRIAMYKESLKQIADQPLGWGYGRNAFGHAMKVKYGEGVYQGLSHSHSAILDFTVSTGLPGIALWLALLLCAVRSARWRTLSGETVFLWLLCLSFFTRSLLDSVMRDHMMEQFMFFLGLAVAMAAHTKPEALLRR